MIRTFALLIALSGAQAQDKPQDWVDPAAAAAAPETPVPEGWAYKLKLGSNISFTHNDTVVGLDDGSYFQLGVLLDAAANLKRGQHSWTNTLAVKHQQSKSPTIDEFVKSADELALLSEYRYALKSIPWIGPFARFRLTTALFPSELIRAEDSQVRRLDAKGNEEEGAMPVDAMNADAGTFHETLDAQKARELTAAFEPLVLRETAGFFADPVDSKAFKLSFSLGAGAQEVIAQDGYVVADDDGTAAIEIRQLQSYNEVGAEFEAKASGEFTTAVAWELSLNLLHPFVTTADTDLEGTELTNYEFGAKLSTKLSSWASLDYVFSAKRIPLIQEDFQVQNNLLLTAGFNIL